MDLQSASDRDASAERSDELSSVAGRPQALNALLAEVRDENVERLAPASILDTFIDEGERRIRFLSETAASTP